MLLTNYLSFIWPSLSLHGPSKDNLERFEVPTTSRQKYLSMGTRKRWGPRVLRIRRNRGIYIWFTFPGLRPEFIQMRMRYECWSHKFTTNCALSWNVFNSLANIVAKKGVVTSNSHQIRVAFAGSIRALEDSIGHFDLNTDLIWNLTDQAYSSYTIIIVLILGFYI